MKKLKQQPTIVPYRMGTVKVGSKEFKGEHGNQGRTLMSQILVDDKDVSARIKNDKVLNGIREYILTQTVYTIDMATGLRVVPTSTNFFGGSVYSLDKTEEGFFLCTFRDTDKSGDGQPHPSDRIGGVLVYSLDSVTKEGLTLLEEEGLLVEEGEEKLASQIWEAKEDTFDPEQRSMNDGEVLQKINQLMEDKMAGKTKKVSKAI